jgi:hypothetical protein
MAFTARNKQPAELVERIRKDIDVAELRLAQCLRAQAEYAERSVTDQTAVKAYDEATRNVGLVRDEIARLKLALVAAQERARQADAERVAKARAANIQRVEALLAKRDQVGAELAAAVKIVDEMFRSLLALGRDIAAAWPLGPHDGSSCILTPGSITRALQHEIFRVGSRPRMLGGQDEPDALTHLPGGMSPTLEFINQPNKVVPLVDVLTLASQHFIEIMRTGKVTPNGTHTQIEQRPRTDAEIRLSDLLKEQAALASDPAGEERYQANLTEIAKITAEIEAEKAGVQP